MNDNVLRELYEVVLSRKENPMEGSYTCYLFEKGLDKILKKVGEESAETIIAAKNENQAETVGEISDLYCNVLGLRSHHFADTVHLIWPQKFCFINTNNPSGLCAKM